MKRRLSFLWVAFAISLAFPDCNPSIQSFQTPGSALVKIECQNASARQIVEFLRLSKGKDISITADGAISGITAAFSPVDTPPDRLQRILRDLDNFGGVLHIELMENPRPIRENF